MFEKAVWLINPYKESFWVYRHGRWERLPDNAKPPRKVLVVIDSPEEVATSEYIPQLGFIDRALLMRRRVNTLWPDSVFSGSFYLGGFRRGGYAAFFAVLGGSEIREAIYRRIEEGIYVQGIRTTSLLLWEKIRKEKCKSTCLVVAHLQDGVRILATSDSRPIMTRFLRINDARELDEEILITWRYLVNQGFAPRNSAPEVVTIVHSNSDFTYSELLQSYSRVELAPLPLRVPLITLRFRRLLATSLSAFIILFIYLLSYDLSRYSEYRDLFLHLGNQIGEIKSQLSVTEKRLIELGIKPDLLRQAANLYTKIIENQRKPESDFEDLATILTNVSPLWRAKQIVWYRITGEQNSLFKADLSTPNIAYEKAATGILNDQLQTQKRDNNAMAASVKLTIVPTVSLRPVDLERWNERITTLLSTLPGARVYNDDRQESNKLSTQRSDSEEWTFRIDLGKRIVKDE